MGKPKIAAIGDSALSSANLSVALAAQFIPVGARVGIAGAPIGGVLPHGCAVTPHTDADIILALDVLGGAENLEQYFGSLALRRRPILIDYHPRDFGGRGLGLCELKTLFDGFGYRIECSQPCEGGTMLMRLTPAERLVSVRPPRVAVLSLAAPRGFGEQLGERMIYAVLPAAADVTHVTPSSSFETYDLLIVGSGNSMVPTDLTEELFAALDCAPMLIGIFGICYRPLIPRPPLDRLIERCDIWCARHEDDALLFSNGRRNVVHLGDWRIDACPLGRATDAEPLDIGPDQLRTMTADAAMETIQRHRTVTARDPAALLCALTAAEVAAYVGCPEENRSLLMDVFGRAFPEHEGFLVDRDAVARYKTRVRENVTALRERIAATLAVQAAVAA